VTKYLSCAVCINAAHFVRALAPSAVAPCFELIFQGRVHDLGLVDALVRLAARDEVPNRRALRDILSVADASTSLWHGALLTPAAADGDDDEFAMLDESATDVGEQQSSADDNSVNDDPDALGLRLAHLRVPDLGDSFERFAALRSVFRRVLAAWTRLSNEVKQYWLARPSLAAQLLPDAQTRFGRSARRCRSRRRWRSTRWAHAACSSTCRRCCACRRSAVDAYAGLLDALLAEPTYAAVFGTDLAAAALATRRRRRRSGARCSRCV
jgi:hypothetical protein